MNARKLIFSLLICTLLILSVTACGKTTTQPAAGTTEVSSTDEAQAVAAPYSIVGIWKGEYDGAEVIYNFEASGSVSYTAYGRLEVGTYILDYSKSPYWMTLTFVNPQDDTQYVTIHSIFEWVNENQLKMENVYPNEPRPEAFKDFFFVDRFGTEGTN
jgi:hypothetical protein